MTDGWLNWALRQGFRWYLRRFPLRDGKARLYEALHESLRPPERFALVRVYPGFSLRCDLRDPEQLKIYFYGHYHERYEARLIAQLLRPYDHFWDIGANIGYFSLLAAAALQHTGGVVALEPGGAAYAGLLENLAVNDFKNIRAFKLAAAAQSGEGRLYLSPQVAADTGASLYQGGADRDQVEMVRTVALDDFLEQEHLPPPQVMKIDVEGAELAVLQGAAGLLAEEAPLMLLEMEAKTLTAAGTDKTAIQKFLSPLGYRGAFLHKGRWYETADMEKTKGRNIFWFCPDRDWHQERIRPLGIVGS